MQALPVTPFNNCCRCWQRNTKDVMQSNLKQTEIIAALKRYIAGQGISLQGKSVDMAFTAGRKEAGISVEISIEDISLPDFGLPEEVPTAKLTLVADPVVTPTASIATEETATPVIEAQTEEDEQAEVAPAPAAPVSRLFS